MVSFTTVLAACLFTCMALGEARTPDEAEAPSAWEPAEGPSVSAEADSFVISKGTVPTEFQKRTPGSVTVPQITYIGLANSPEYKAQCKAAQAALNLPPVNSVNAVDVSRARKMTFVNLYPFEIWAGVSGNNGGPVPGGGGWVLPPYAYIKFSLPVPFIGARFWGRTSCKAAPSDPTCANYTCSSYPTGCTLTKPTGHTTLFEIHFGKTGTNLDFYDISLVDAYNLAMNIVPVPGSYAGASINVNRTNSCGSIAFASNLNKNCPAPLRELKDGSGTTVECRNQCGLPATRNIPLCASCTGSGSCVTNQNSLTFKNSCPGAYSFSYDDATSTYVCRGADYQVQFGVIGEKAFYIPL